MTYSNIAEYLLKPASCIQPSGVISGLLSVGTHEAAADLQQAELGQMTVSPDSHQLQDVLVYMEQGESFLD